MKLNAGEHILKTREDSFPIKFTSSIVTDASPGEFQLVEDEKCSWLRKGQAFGVETLRTRIEPWLTALFGTVCRVENKAAYHRLPKIPYRAA